MFVIQRLQIYPLFFTGKRSSYWSLKVAKAKKYGEYEEAEAEIVSFKKNYGIHVADDCVNVYTVDEARENMDEAELKYAYNIEVIF